MQAVSMISRQEERLSAENQAKVPLDFQRLEKAVPAEVALDRKKLKSMYHNEAISTINDFAKQGIFLPLELVSVVITKFCSSRLGTIEEAENFFALALRNYQPKDGDGLKENTDQKIGKLFAELIWVYIHKREYNEQRVNDLVRMCPCVDTYTALTAFYNRVKLFDKTLDLHAKWPDGIAKDGSTYRYWAYALSDSGKRTEDIQAFYEEAKQRHPELMKDPYFVVDYIKLCKRNSKYELTSEEFLAIEQLFLQFPEYRSEDKLLRELFKACFDSKNFKKAKYFLDKTKDCLSLKTWELVAMRLSECSLRTALAECGDHLGTKVDYEQGEIILNFHKDTLSSHGAEEYGAQENILIELKLWHLVQVLLNPQKFPQKDLQRVRILIITGKGTSLKLKKLCLAYLASTFRWNKDVAPKQSGCIKFDQTILSLFPKPLAIPQKLSKELSLACKK